MPFESRNIVLIGAGNVAYSLGRAFKHSDNRLIKLIARTEEKAERLAFELGCPYSTDFNSIPDHADIVIIAVSDDAIAAVARQFHCPGVVVVHTSGSMPMDTLGDCSDRLGVFYPLQTMHRNVEINMRQVPFCIEGNSNWTAGILMELASTLSDNVQLIDEQQRRMVHLAAVFACNFSNHCYTLADELLTSSGLSLDILRPLIRQTADNAQKGSPVDLQTGPAKRGDTQVLKEHLEKLNEMSAEFQDVYRSLSTGIANRAGQNLLI